MDNGYVKTVLDLEHALRTMLVAVDKDIILPSGHPGHNAFLHTVAIPRAERALCNYKKIKNILKREGKNNE